jgi:micrococcal nuclease
MPRLRKELAGLGLQNAGTGGMKTYVMKTSYISVSRGSPVIKSPNMKWGTVVVVLVLIIWRAPAGICEESWSGKCVGISDGDTIRVMHRGRETKIRLYGIDCPEIGQDFGREARRFTGKMAFGKIVTVQEMDTDRYGRLVAWVRVDGQSLNKELLKAGLAWWYQYYAPRDIELKSLEAEAREAETGIWSHPSPIPPWEFRKESRTDR